MPFPDEPRQPLQRAEVGGHADIDFPDGEQRVGAAQANVAGGDQIDTAADARTVNRGDDRLSAAFDRCQRVLQIEDQPAQLLPRPSVAGIGDFRADRAEQCEVDSRGELTPRAAD